MPTNLLAEASDFLGPCTPAPDATVRSYLATKDIGWTHHSPSNCPNPLFYLLVSAPSRNHFSATTKLAVHKGYIDSQADILLRAYRISNRSLGHTLRDNGAIATTSVRPQLGVWQHSKLLRHAVVDDSWEVDLDVGMRHADNNNNN